MFIARVPHASRSVRHVLRHSNEHCASRSALAHEPAINILLLGKHQHKAQSRCNRPTKPCLSCREDSPGKLGTSRSKENRNEQNRTV